MWWDPFATPPAPGAPAGHLHTHRSEGSRARGAVSVFPAGRRGPVGQRGPSRPGCSMTAEECHRTASGPWGATWWQEETAAKTPGSTAPAWVSSRVCGVEGDLAQVCAVLLSEVQSRGRLSSLQATRGIPLILSGAGYTPRTDFWPGDPRRTRPDGSALTQGWGPGQTRVPALHGDMGQLSPPRRWLQRDPESCLILCSDGKLFHGVPTTLK